MKVASIDFRPGLSSSDKETIYHVSKLKYKDLKNILHAEHK